MHEPLSCWAAYAVVTAIVVVIWLYLWLTVHMMDIVFGAMQDCDE